MCRIAFCFGRLDDSYPDVARGVIARRYFCIPPGMNQAAKNTPPSFITATRNGRKWPPNRGSIPAAHTFKDWQQQDPTIQSIARRPMPKNFIRAFSILGWREAPWYYRCSWRVVGRWVNEAGKEAVLAERAAMRRNPDRPRLKAMMAAYWNGEPRDLEWLVEQARQSG